MAFFGALGAVARFRVDSAVSARLPSDFPLGTLVVNLTGSFALGVLVGASVTHRVAFLLGTGFTGGYTTFSTWMVESERLGEVGEVVVAAAEPVAVDAGRVRHRRGGFLRRAGDHMISAGLKLDVYFGESLNSGRRMANDALMDCFARHELEVAALYRGIEGFGIGRRIHTERFPDISTDLPLIAEAIDTRERIEAVLPDVHAIIDKGLVTIEHSLLAVGEDVRTAEFPDGAGSAGRLTVYCGRGERSAGRPAYRAVVDLLRRQGASGATVLLGVDGIHNGQRQRAGLLSRNVNVPDGDDRRRADARPAAGAASPARRARPAGGQPRADRRRQARRRPP